MIVSISKQYSHKKLVANINSLKNKFSFLTLGNIGYSVLGNSIPFIRVGVGEREVFYSASYHANEWITSIILMKFIEDFCEAFSNNSFIYGYSAKNIFYNTSIYIVPMVNPDGVNLVNGIYDTDSQVYQNAKYIANNYASISFTDGWKANIRGVDLKIYQLFHFFYSFKSII